MLVDWRVFHPTYNWFFWVHLQSEMGVPCRWPSRRWNRSITASWLRLVLRGFMGSWAPPVVPQTGLPVGFYLRNPVVLDPVVFFLDPWSCSFFVFETKFPRQDFGWISFLGANLLEGRCWRSFFFGKWGDTKGHMIHDATKRTCLGHQKFQVPRIEESSPPKAVWIRPMQGNPTAPEIAL